jgi:Trk K+ transport system NAD-binding subunit
MKPRIIIGGLGRTGYQVFRLIQQQGAAVVGVHDRPLPTLEAEFSKDILIGNLSDPAIWLQAGIRDTHTLVLTSSNDALNLEILTQARVLNPRIRIVNRLFNASLGDRLDETLPDHFTMSVAALAAPVFTFAALGNRAIGQLRLFGQIWPIREERIHEHHPWWGRQLSQLWDDRSRMLIYYLPVHRSTDLISAVIEGQYLQAGDRLIVATQPQMQTARRSLEYKLLGLLASFRAFQKHVRPAIIVTLVLIVTILIATLAYVTANSHTSIIDALYFSVGMITGAGGNETVVEHVSIWTKLFTIVMMLVGAAVVGIFYALLNDFVLGTRLQQVWNIGQVPHRRHYIVCGLGGLGIQIVQQLQESGCEVVAIERDANNRFLNTARSLKVPVIQGDANLDATLDAAHIKGAAALLVVTSDDVINLEIALTAKGIAPKLPVIVRNQNPQFAPLAQQVFDFEAVLSPAELSAPSFAAAALGGQILGNGMTANTLWVALATLITPHHPLFGQRVQDIARTLDCVPLYLENKRQTIHGWDLLDASLQAGDRLYLTLPATHLEQLWRTPANPRNCSV